MSYGFNLYTPDLKMRGSGKFVACEKLMDHEEVGTFLSYYDNYAGKKYLNIYGSIIVLNKWQCMEADEVTNSTFFTDFIDEYDCNGMIIKVV